MTPRLRLTTGAAVVAATATALLTGPLSTGASAATSFRTIDDNTATQQLTITSNKALTFTPRFGGVQTCSTCGVPNTPANLTWSQQKPTPAAKGVAVINKANHECIDLTTTAQTPGASGLGATVITAPCDGTLSQQWTIQFATGNQSTFKNNLNGLILTNTNGKVILERPNFSLPASQRSQHVQNFGSTLVSTQ